MTSVATEEHERQLWDELNSLAADAVPAEAGESETEDAILLALMGRDAEIHEVYEQVKRLARDKVGYLREKLKEDTPIGRARRRLYGKWADGEHEQ